MGLCSQTPYFFFTGLRVITVVPERQKHNFTFPPCCRSPKSC